MSNMSYCRFRNILENLEDCADHIHDDDTDLGFDEVIARRKLIEYCAMIVEETEE